MTREQDYQDLADLVEAVAIGDEIEWSERKPVINDEEARAFLKSIGVDIPKKIKMTYKHSSKKWIGKSMPYKK